MRGRGLLIAAAVLQLVAAAGALVGIVGVAAMAASGRHPSATYLPVAALLALLAAALVVLAIGVLRLRAWAWIASVAVDGVLVVGLLVAGAPLALVPLAVAIGLLIGGRRAVFASQAKTAAEPLAITPPSGG